MTSTVCMFQQYHLYTMDMSGDELLDSQHVMVPSTFQSVSPTTFSTQLVKKLSLRNVASYIYWHQQINKLCKTYRHVCMYVVQAITLKVLRILYRNHIATYVWTSCVLHESEKSKYNWNNFTMIQVKLLHMFSACLLVILQLYNISYLNVVFFIPVFTHA